MRTEQQPCQSEKHESHQFFIIVFDRYWQPGGLLVLIFAGYVWPLRAPTPLQSILWPIIDPILVTFGQICNFCVPNLVTFYLRIYLILNEEHLPGL